MTNGKRNLIISNILIVLFFLSSVAFVSYYGISNRKYLDAVMVSKIEKPESAYYLWNEKGIKGRILFLFDRHVHDSSSEESITEWNYVYKAMRANLVRKVYHVVPDNAWPQVEAVLGKSSRAQRDGDAFRFVVEGMPVVVMRIRDISGFKEKVLIDINGDWWKGEDLMKVAGLIKQGTLKSDLISICGDVPETDLQMFGPVNAR